MKSIIIILFLTCCMVQVSYAQISVNPVTCLMDSFSTILPLFYSTYSGHTTTVLGVDIGTVDYHIATDPTGKKHISIDWSTLSGKNPHMSDLAIREFIINDILRSYGVGTYNLYYKEDCIKEMTCTISLAFPEDSAICCQVPTNDQSFWMNQTYTLDWEASFGFRYFDIKKKVVCGYKCCMDSYTITNDPTPLSIVRTQGQGFGTSMTSCPENNDYHCKQRQNGWGSNRIVIPCEEGDGCYQWR